MRPTSHLLAGQFASRLGDAIGAVGLTYLALDAGAGKSAAADVLLVRSLPFLVVGPLVALFVDRLPRRGSLIGADVLRFVLTIVLVVLYARDELGVPGLAVLLFAITVATSVFEPVRDAWLPELDHPTRLNRNNSLLRTSEFLALMLGPLAAGVALRAAEFWHVRPLTGLFACDALSYLVSGLLLYGLPSVERPAVRTSARVELARFARILRDRRWRRVLAITAVNNVGIMGPASFALPILVEETLGLSKAHFAWTVLVLACGCSATSFLLSRLERLRRPARLWLWGLLFDGATHVPMILVGASLGFEWLLVFMLVHSFFPPFVMIPRTYFLQRALPAEDRGKAFALVHLGVLGVAGISIKLVAEAMERGVSPGACLAWGGLLAMGTSIWGFCDPVLRDLDAQADSEGPPAVGSVAGGA